MNRMRSKLFIIIAILLVIVAVISYLSFNYISKLDRYAVRIDIFPKNALITLDDKEVKRGTVYLEQGSYSIKASSEGFIEFSDTLTVGPHLKTYVMTLQPENEAGRNYYDKYASEYAEVRKLSEQAVKESGEYFYKRNPIASKLPYRSFSYTIGYRLDQSDPSGNSIIVEIDASEGYKQAALYRIYQLGFDPTDLTINFRDYENPFPL